MSAPAGIRVKKVKIPAFPFRPRAEAIVYSHLTDEERELLALRSRYSHGLDSSDEKDREVESLAVKVQQDAQGMTIEMGSVPPKDAEKSSQRHRNQEDLFAEGLDAEWLEYVGEDDPEIESQTSGNPAVVLYFHGGGYYTGSKEEHRVLIGPLVKRLGKNIRILNINYRLAPQHPFPAALVDALSSYMWLMEQSISESFSRSNAGGLNDCFQPSQIVFMGDSAGGGLALSLSLLIRDHGSLPQPLSIVTWSPWLDLTQSLPSFKENALADVIPYEDFVHLHSDAVDKMFSHPSEDDGAHGGGPRTCGSAERFFNECVLMAARLEEQQQPCRIDIHEDMPHIFPLFRFHTSSSAALDRTCAYIREIVNKGHAVTGRNDVIIPISSTSPSLSPSAAQLPLLTSKQLDQFTTDLSSGYDEEALSNSSTLPFLTNPFGRPASVYRVDSSSSVSSNSSTSSVGSSTSVSSGKLPSPTVRHSKLERKSLAFDPQSDPTLAQDSTNARSSRAKTAVNVVDLSGCAVMSYHKQTRYGPCEALRADMANSPQRRQHRRKALSLKDVVSDATLYEWEVLLKQGYIPTRHWPLPPNSRA
ncbi:hypothetical protein BGZ58_000926 [Dissophora ornata]|nr:hypothetical protein BGZ58_000926 [Dissophora ornata]